MELKIDQEFKDLIPALSVDEVLNLEQSILNEGYRDSLVTWNGYLIDGHNRYAICTKHGIPFTINEMEFDSRADVEIWMIRNQKGRRNVSTYVTVSYTHLRAHETDSYLVCRLLLEKKKK